MSHWLIHTSYQIIFKLYFLSACFGKLLQLLFIHLKVESNLVFYSRPKRYFCVTSTRLPQISVASGGVYVAKNLLSSFRFHTSIKHSVNVSTPPSSPPFLAQAITVHCAASCTCFSMKMECADLMINQTC